MEIEGRIVVWLTADEVMIAIRNYVRSKFEIASGRTVTPCASVTGLDDLTLARHAVSVVVEHTSEEVT